MQLDLWYIDGTSFHFGKHGLGEEESDEHLGSDSIFSAVVARMVETRGTLATEEFVQVARGDAPPFVLSSAFPRAGDICLFPTPLESPAGSSVDAHRYKELKKCKYVSGTTFNAVIAGKSLAEVFPGREALGENVLLQNGKVLVDESEVKALPASVRPDGRIWSIVKRPRVAVGRAAANSQIYHTGQTVFHDTCGLWFAVRWISRDDTLARTLADAFADLGDAGLGGKRSVGFGHCRIERHGTLELPDAEDAHWVTLSRYLPRSDEMDALFKGTAYTIESVGGWVNSPIKKSERRRTVRMIAEGSVLGRVSRAVPGQLVDVRPIYDGKPQLEHPVWRSGLALAVGIQPRTPRKEAR